MLPKFFQRISRCESVYDVIYVKYLLYKFFGFTIFTVDGRPQDGKVKLTAWDVFSLVRVLAMEAVVFYVSYTTLQSWESTGSSILDNGTRYTFVGGSLYISLVTLLNYRRYRGVWKTFAKMDRFDGRAKQINAPVDQRTQQIRVLQSIAGLIISFVLMTISGIAMVFWSEETSIYRWSIPVSVIFFNIPFLLMQHQVLIVTYLVYYRVQHLNATFEVHFIPQKEPTLVILAELPAPRSIHDKPTILHNLVIQWDEIRRIVQRISNEFYAQLIFVVLVSIMIVTFSLFALYRAFLTGDRVQMVRALMYMECDVYYLVMLVLFTWSADGIKREAVKTAVLAHKALRELENERVQDDLLLFSQMVNHQVPVIDCGVFLCDWKLVLSIFGTVTSYLVILIQFDASLVT
ncbi:uncharacterized protein LOC120421601 [Culex pipiens pallens]|uniref:uncharacterized protein LOC120421601 n=1 Tax=Culex pipiens pallens TaxID=42434 RepID=UPI001953C499|nr:uncharacterized protein LOC120421601 [Culex pipiens pallens]